MSANCFGFWGPSSRPSTWASCLDFTGGLLSPDSQGYSPPPIKIYGAATDWKPHQAPEDWLEIASNTARLTGYSGEARHELGAYPQMSLSPHRVTYWSRIRRCHELCEIFKFWPFLWSKSVNNVCKLFQLLGDASWSHWKISISQTPWAIAPKR